MFTVDGVQWSIPCDITRIARVQDSEISGKLLNGAVFHDVDGTYYDYEVTLVPNPHSMNDYYELYEILTQPVDGHQFVLPYNGTTLQVTAKVEQPRDVYVRVNANKVYWKGMRFNLTANAPSKQMSLGEVIQRGLTPLPDVASVEIGDTYTYTASGWVKVD